MTAGSSRSCGDGAGSGERRAQLTVLGRSSRAVDRRDRGQESNPCCTVVPLLDDNRSWLLPAFMYYTRDNRRKVKGSEPAGQKWCEKGNRAASRGHDRTLAATQGWVDGSIHRSAAGGEGDGFRPGWLGFRVDPVLRVYVPLGGDSTHSAADPFNNAATA